jgi:O-antigen/teichoic acid export membrane protein
LAGGSVVVQAIPILAMPILTRLYTPQNFSVLAGFTALVGVVGTVVTGRYEMAIMHSYQKEEAFDVARLAIICAIVIGSLLGLPFALFAGFLSQLLGQPLLEAWLPWIFIPLICSGVMQSLNILLSWNKDFRGISIGRTLQNLSNSGSAIALGFARLGQGQLAAFDIGLLAGAAYFAKKIGFTLPWGSVRRCLSRAKHFSKYPIYAAPAAVLDAISTSMTIFILGRFYLPDILGQFSLTHRLLLVPMVLMGSSVGQAFFQHASEAYRNGDKLYPLLLSTGKKLFLYSMPLFLLIILFAPWGFSILFGTKWRMAGEFTQIVALAYWIRVAVSPVSSIFMVVHRLQVGTYWQFGYFCTTLIILGGAGFLRMPISSFFIVYTIHEVVLYAIYFLLARWVCLSL